MKKVIQFTKEGLEKTQQEYDELQLKRKDAVKELATARDLGDRSENGAYKAARWKLSQIDSRLRHLTMLLRFGKVVEAPPDGSVGLGSTIIVDNGKEEKTFTIVGGYESDLTTGKISSFSPIGKALMNKKLGDNVEVSVPAGTLHFLIKKIV